jgi:hypothetical protein
MSDTTLYNTECVVLMILLVSFALVYAVRRLRRTRPDFDIGRPLAIGYVLRLVTIAVVSVSGQGLTLRGGDENTFLADARRIAASGFDSNLWFPAQFHRLHEIVFALQIKLGDFGDAPMRVTQVGMALLGIVLILAAIHDLAGPHAARVAAWVFALEPASNLYNGILHREPMLVLASGLVILGGSKVWARLELRGVLMIAAGCLIAVAIRPYAGWFLMAGGLLLTLHAAIRQVGSTLRALPFIYGGVVAIVIAMPWVLHLTSDEKLEQTLQVSQNANTNLYTVRGAGVGLNNLALERVDFSSRTALVTNLPLRVRDIVLRPYPWQLQNTAQRLGAIGTAVALAGLFLLIAYLRRNRGRIMTVAAPLIYPTVFLTLAYALSVGNAGTGFRYRTHLVLLGLGIMVILREHAKRDEAAQDATSQADEPLRRERRSLASAALR